MRSSGPRSAACARTRTPPSATRHGAVREATSADAAFGALEIPSTSASPSAAPIATTSTGRPYAARRRRLYPALVGPVAQLVRAADS